MQVSTFNPDQVLYTKVPSPDVIGDSIYQLITSATALMYTVSFTQVQNGDYNLNTGSNNGRVYTYVGKRYQLEVPVKYTIQDGREIVKNFKNSLKKVKKIDLQNEQTAGAVAAAV